MLYIRWIAQLSDEEKRGIHEQRVSCDRLQAPALGTLVEGQRATGEEGDGGAEAEKEIGAVCKTMRGLSLASREHERIPPVSSEHERTPSMSDKLQTSGLCTQKSLI